MRGPLNRGPPKIPVRKPHLPRFCEPGFWHSYAQPCGSLAENCGDLRRLRFYLRNDQQVFRRFAETTNPRKNCAEKHKNPGSWNSLAQAVTRATAQVSTGVDSFQTGSGQTGSSQKCPDSPYSTFMRECRQNLWQHVVKCGNMCALESNYYKMWGICGASVKTSIL